MTSYPGASEIGCAQTDRTRRNVAPPPRPPLGRRCDRIPGAAGFTLMELLTVLVIISLLGGISAGVFQVIRRNVDLSATASRLEGLLIAARNTAISSGSPVEVVVSPASGTARAFAFEAVGEWSFEDTNGDVTHGVPFEPARLHGAGAGPGYLGRGVSLGGNGYVDCGNSPRFDLNAGLHFEAWIRLERPLGEENPRERSRSRGTRRIGTSRSGGSEPLGEVIVRKGDAFALGLTPDGGLEGGIGFSDRPGLYLVRTPPATVVPGRWTLVSMRFDGMALDLAADGIERSLELVGYVGVDPEDYPELPYVVPIDPAPLTLGSSTGSLAGALDEVRLRGMTEPPTFRVPPNQIVLGWKRHIWFDRRGHLDPRYHDGPLRLVVCEITADDRAATTDPKKTEVRVDFSVTFEEWKRKTGRQLDGLREEDEVARLEMRYQGRRRVEIVIDRIGTVR